MASKKKRKYTPSSGSAKKSRLRRALRRTDMKIARWDRYKEEIAAGTRRLPVYRTGKKKGETNNSRWDTTKLEKHHALLQSLLKAAK